MQVISCLFKSIILTNHHQPSEIRLIATDIYIRMTLNDCLMPESGLIGGRGLGGRNLVYWVFSTNQLCFVRWQGDGWQECDQAPVSHLSRSHLTDDTNLHQQKSWVPCHQAHELSLLWLYWLLVTGYQLLKEWDLFWRVFLGSCRNVHNLVLDDGRSVIFAVLLSPQYPAPVSPRLAGRSSGPIWRLSWFIFVLFTCLNFKLISIACGVE